MKIAIASDHAGFKLKTMLSNYLNGQGHQVIDFGTHSEDPVDYPDFIHPAAAAVARGECDRGIMLGGSGNGEAMTANRHRGVRCALCWNEEAARLGRAHNDANAIAMGEWMVTGDLAKKLVDIWLATPFEGGRHLARLRKMDDDTLTG